MNTVLAYAGERFTENELADIPSRDFKIHIDPNTGRGGGVWKITGISEASEQLDMKPTYILQVELAK